MSHSTPVHKVWLAFSPSVVKRHTAVVEISYRWPPACVVSSQLQDLVAMIFQPSKTRVSMQGIIDHPWMTSNGQLRSLHVSSPRRPMDEQLLRRCVELGLPHAELEDSLMTGRNNMLTATYHMLEAQQEAAQRRRGSNAIFVDRMISIEAPEAGFLNQEAESSPCTSPELLQSRSSSTPKLPASPGHNKCRIA